MITVIRRQAKSRFSRIVLLIIVFSMTIGGSLFVPGLLRQVAQTTKAIITVNGYPISAEYFTARLAHEQDKLESFRQQFGSQADIFLHALGLANPQKIAYDAIIQEALLNNAAREIWLPVSSLYTAEQLQNPSFVLQELADVVPMSILDQNGTINIGALRKYLQYTHLTMLDFEQLVENALSRSTIKQILNSTAYVSRYEMHNQYMKKYAPKNYSVLHFYFDRYLQKAVELNPSGEELKKFFDQENQSAKRYWIPEKRDGILLEFSSDNFDISIPFSDIENYYAKYKHTKYVHSLPKVKLRRIVLKVTNALDSQEIYSKLEKIKESVDRDPTLFEKYALEYPEDKKTSLKSDVLPWYERNDLNSTIGTAAFRLSKDGDISSILKTDEGYEIIQRVARKPKEFKSLDLVKEDIEKLLKKQQFNDKFRLIMKQKISNKKSRDSFAEIKKAYNAHEKNLNAVTLSDSKLSKELFKLKKNEATYYIDNGTGFVILLLDIKKAHIPEFDESIKSRVKEDWYEHKARQMLNNDIQQAKQLSEHESFGNIAQKFDVSLNSIEGLFLEDKNSENYWSAKGYPVVDFYAIQHVGQIKIFEKKQDSFLVKFESIDRTKANGDLFGRKKDEILRDLYQQNYQCLERGFVASLQRNATIKLNDDSNILSSVKHETKN